VGATCILVPAPPVFAKHLTGFTGLKELHSLWYKASKWTSLSPEKRKKSEWVWQSVIKRDSTREGLLKAVDALHELRERGSDLSPILWAWWRMSKKLEEPEATGFEFLHIWSAAALKSARMRRWFYEEIAFEHLCRRKFWPAASAVALAAYKEFELEACLRRPEEHKQLWLEKYKERYDTALAQARQVQDDASYKIRKAAEDSDLGVWLSPNPMAYLKCGAATSSLANLTKVPGLTRRKRTAKV
jgi:hypothetical protein